MAGPGLADGCKEVPEVIPAEPESTRLAGPSEPAPTRPKTVGNAARAPEIATDMPYGGPWLDNAVGGIILNPKKEELMSRNSSRFSLQKKGNLIRLLPRKYPPPPPEFDLSADYRDLPAYGQRPPPYIRLEDYRKAHKNSSIPSPPTPPAKS